MYLKITIISFLISICYVMSSKIGNYSQYIADYEKCGLSWNSLLMNSQCFENRYDFSPPLIEGRDALKGEVPWMVQIQYPSVRFAGITFADGNCGGSLLSNEWVLTNAHCMGHSDIGKYYVYTDLKAQGGDYYYANKQFIHPDYTGKDTYYKYDLALIKLKEKIPMESTTDQQNIGTICLPSKKFTDRSKQFARSAGFGTDLSHLQITTYAVERLPGYSWSLLIFSIIDKGQTCEGDSGSPVWMYENGRAFLVGVVSTRYDEGCSRSGGAVFVPDSIDWILKTMVEN